MRRPRYQPNLALASISILLLLALVFVGGSAGESTGAASFIVANNCIEHQAFFEGTDSAVAASLPSGFVAERDPAGRPLLFARAERCQVTLGGNTVPVTMASFGVVIQSPDGRGCSSGAPVIGPSEGQLPPVCNWYLLFWLANDRRIVNWLKAGTPAFPAVYVPGLVFRLGDFDPSVGGAPFHFQAPAPAPSPFTMDDVGRERPGTLSVRGGYWVSSRPQTIKLAFSTDNLTSGDATGNVRTARGSQMAKLMGGDDASYLPGYSGLAAERWSYGSYRKQVSGPPPAGQRNESFSGSCSVQGTVDFKPPATNTSQPLTYNYLGKGACNGKLNGRHITNSPVTLRHSGGAQGSCPQAFTTAPGQGEITFSDGTTVKYTLDFSSVGTDVTFTFYGQRWGTADAQGNFLTQRTPPDLTLQCASGVAQVPMDLSLSTENALVSLSRSPMAPPARASHHFLDVTVIPRRTSTGQRTSFTFRVTTRHRHPVPGALIRVAGRQARTGKAGRARMTFTLSHSGRWTAHITKPGYRTATVTIVARPATAR